MSIQLQKRSLETEDAKVISAEQYENLKELRRKQTDCGLGHPDVEKLFSGRVNFVNDRVREVAKTFELVERPDFPRENQRYWRLPKLIMTSFGDSSYKSEVQVRKHFHTGVFRAPLPMVPATAQELVRRFKKLAQRNFVLWMVFQPSWEWQPQADPVLLGQLTEGDFWFKIAEWDGDAELISSLLKEVK